LPDANPQAIAEYIKQHCAPWLKHAGPDVVLYRGTNSLLGMEVATKKPRMDRRPTNTKEPKHRLFDTLIKMAGGTANRTNSVFVSPHRDDAASYGSLFVVYPMGEFHYTWSPVYRDWFVDFRFSDMVREIPKKYHDLAKKEELHGLDYMAAWRFNASDDIYNLDLYDPRLVQEIILTDQGIHDAVDGLNEVMITAENILYVDEELAPDVQEFLR
ncbi:MAG TPA: hypothetical protein VJ946_11460, partial [Bacteroidales bacterium]|nr:hypothetical protein [Bacteroidales bacterium]